MPSPIPVIIHFVGLALFSSQVPNDCGLRAILPNVVHADPMTSNAQRIAVQKPPRAGVVSSAPSHAAALGTTGAVPINPPHVEDHVALLAFKTGSYLPGSNWGPPLYLPGTNNSYQYVKLDGERIRFQSGIQQGLVSNLLLPKLSELCSLNHFNSLNANFQPPYSGAVAVFDLPQGIVYGCQFHSQRFDTEVALTSSGVLTVSASTMRVRKEIRLQNVAGTIELIVANVPARCLTTGCGQPSATNTSNMTHVHAYYEMGDGPTTSCGSVADWLSTHSNEAATIPCSMTTIPNAAGGYVPEQLAKGGTLSNRGDNFECSNSAWP